jgi:hypothetical protein
LRLGVAVRGTRERDETGEERDDFPSYSSEGTQNIRDFWEYAIGLGLDLGGAEFDVTLALVHDELQMGSARVSSSDTLASQFLSEGDGTYNLSARFGMPLTSRLRWIGAATYGERDLEWTGMRFEPSGRLRIRRLGDAGIGWSAATAVVVATPYVDRVIVAGSYDRLAYATFSMYRWSGGRIDRLDRWFRNASLSLAASHGLWRTVSMQASVSKAYRFERTDTRDDYLGEDIFMRTERLERFSDRFAWGVTATWRRFDVAASVNTNLELIDLVAALDVRLGL